MSFLLINMQNKIFATTKKKINEKREKKEWQTLSVSQVRVIYENQDIYICYVTITTKRTLRLTHLISRAYLDARSLTGSGRVLQFATTVAGNKQIDNWICNCKLLTRNFFFLIFCCKSQLPPTTTNKQTKQIYITTKLAFALNQTKPNKKTYCLILATLTRAKRLANFCLT